MPSRACLWKRFVRCLLASCLVVAGAPAWSTAQAVPGAAFDRLANQMERGELVVSSLAEMQRELARLQRDIPPGDAHRALRYRYLNCIYGLVGNPVAGKAYAERGLADAARIGYVDAEINFHFCRGSNQGALSTPRDALSDYDAGIALARKSENSLQLADGLTWRGSVRSLLGDYAHAVVDLLEAQRYYGQAGKLSNQDSNLFDLAIAYRRLGDYAKARGYLQQLMAKAVEKSQVLAQMSVHMELGFVDLGSEGRPPQEALRHFEQALQFATQARHPAAAASAQLGMAMALNRAGQHTQALAALSKAKAAFAQAGNQSDLGMLALQTGVALAGLGKRTQALAEFARAEAVLRDSGNLRYYEALLSARSRTYEALGQDSLALADLQHVQTLHAALDRKARSDTATLMGYQFDVARREQENRQLDAERQLKGQQVQALERVRSWQQLALLLGALLILLLSWLAWRQLRAARQLKQIADTDQLTGVANRRSIEGQGQRMLDRAVADDRAMAVVMFDIDHFKHINDRFGHPAGDVVLMRVAAACREALRQGDLLGRYGGEEFVALLPGVDEECTREIAERLRRAVECLALDDVAPGQRITISLGSAVRHLRDRDFGGLVARADAALYRSKAAGRNRITAADVVSPATA